MKKWAVTGLVLLLAGIVLCTIIWVQADYDITRLNTGEPYQEKMYAFDAGTVQSLEISDDNNGIRLEKSADDQIHISCYERDKEKYALSGESSGQLVLTKEENRRWYEYIGLNLDFTDRSIRIALPEAFTGPVSLSTSNGSINAAHVGLAALDLSTANGSIQASDLSIDTLLQIHTSNGSVTAKNIVSENAAITSSNASIYLEAFEAKSDTNLRTSNGKISFMQLRSPHITLNSSNGSILGQVSGDSHDYMIQGESNNGRANLPLGREDANQSLIARTSNGSIDITFVP